MKRLVLNISLSLLTLFGCISCNIKEDMSNCPGRMILDYSAYSDVVLDDIGADEQIDVFIFDPNGICCDTRTFTYGELQKTNFEFQLPIAYRNYNAVVWQGLNGADYNHQSMVIGKSYTDFILSLISANNTFSGVPDPLWATPLEPIEYCAKITRHRVYMTRVHTEVRVTLQEKLSDGTIQNLNIDDYDVHIDAANDIYHTDCFSMDSQCHKLEYMNEGNEVGTLRITPNMKCMLVVDGIDYEIDLVKYMLETKNDSSLSDQQFLDRNKIWDIKLIVKEHYSGFVAIGININGWVIWFSDSGLS